MLLGAFMRTRRAWSVVRGWSGGMVAVLAEAGRRLVYRRQDLAVLSLFLGSLLVGLGVAGLGRQAPTLLERLEAEPERPLARPRGERARGQAHEGTVHGKAAQGPAPRPGPGAPLDLNTASEADLERLPGIGPRLARRIVEERERAGPFRSGRDLGRVRGLGPRTIEALEPLVTAGASGRSP